MKLVFIAGKLNGKNAWEVACNVHAAETAALRVAELGGMPVVPHSLGRSMLGTLPETFWRAGCLELLARCDAILLLPGWLDSTGSRAESDFAEQRGIMRVGVAMLDKPDFVRWLSYPPERGASIKAAIEADKEARR
jgi:hypothetical protein